MKVRNVNIGLTSKLPLIKSKLAICAATPTSIQNGTCIPIIINVEMRNGSLFKMRGISLRERRSIHEFFHCNCSSSSGRMGDVDDDKQAVAFWFRAFLLQLEE